MNEDAILKAASIVRDAHRATRAAHQVLDDARRALEIAEREADTANHCFIEAREALLNLLSEAPTPAKPNPMRPYWKPWHPDGATTEAAAPHVVGG